MGVLVARWFGQGWLKGREWHGRWTVVELEHFHTLGHVSWGGLGLWRSHLALGWTVGWRIAGSHLPPLSPWPPLYPLFSPSLAYLTGIQGTVWQVATLVSSNDIISPPNSTRNQTKQAIHSLSRKIQKKIQLTV